MSIDDGSEEKSGLERSGLGKAKLSRQVSNEALSTVCSENDENSEKGHPNSPGRASPIRCVSEFDKVLTSSEQLEVPKILSVNFNPLRDAGMYAQHKLSLRLESELQPMRLILSRLMANPTHNRKGIFNTPVDPVALNLPDYITVIRRPMDFGTIKAKLHALAYTSRSAVADDIRLVLENAMKYNPPTNIVHTSAAALLYFFEEQLLAFAPELCRLKTSLKAPPPDTTKATNQEADAAEAQPAAQVIDLSGSEQIPVAPSAHSLATRQHPAAAGPKTSDVTFSRKRRKRGTKVVAGHSCQQCEGRTCLICNQGCLHLEPSLLICSGPHCAGAKIRKSATYYIAPDGSRQYCQRCYIGLPAVLPASSHDDECRYKVKLLKRKNDEEVVERWLTCVSCDKGVHAVCALHNEFAEPKEDYVCPECADDSVATVSLEQKSSPSIEMYSFVSGSDLPVKMSEICGGGSSSPVDSVSAETLPETDESAFIELKIRELMASSKFRNADKTVTVRVISDCSRYFKVPDVVRHHFQMVTRQGSERSVAPPTQVNYRSKAIALFQKMDGLDVCIFCMYVQEYDGDDEYENSSDKELVEPSKRVYIAYLDSVEHFRPRSCRTEVYQELLVSYLATARKRGYQSAHIWACPPSRGNSFVFWNHPASQRTPNMDRLVAWYHGALSRAVDCGVIVDVKSLFETDFERHLEPLFKNSSVILGKPMQCPPLLDGDFWIEEAVRIHAVNSARNMKSRIEAPFQNEDGPQERCPAVEIGTMLRDKVMAHPSAAAFRRPVNAAAMKLKDYHNVITMPMDLGTIYSRLSLGEYRALADIVEEVELVFSNAKLYNPKGHVVHENAIEVSDLFFSELDSLVSTWNGGQSSTGLSWKSFLNTSMSLDATLKPISPETSQASAPSTDGEVSLSKSTDSCLTHGGVDAIQKRMAGSDTWLLEKNSTPPDKQGIFASKKGPGRRKRSNDTGDEPPPKRRRQTWLAEEVGASVRRHRLSFFSCSLQPASSSSSSEADKFEAYVSSYKQHKGLVHLPSRVADARHALLEFSQYRNLEFDTLRRAKYSSTILLYHLHHDDAPGIIPVCSNCHEEISSVRWHRISRVIEQQQRRRVSTTSVNINNKRVSTTTTTAGRRRRRQKTAPSSSSSSYKPEELCTSCHSVHCHKEEFIPLPVSFK